MFDSSTPSYQAVIDFWFDEIDQGLWWKKDDGFDHTIQSRFGVIHQKATQNELSAWRSTAQGSLAEVIVLDQFSRNIYRDLPASFAADSQAVALAQTAVSKGFDKELEPQQRLFLYMPFMHSESKHIHQDAVFLFESLGLPNNLEFEIKHKAIIDKFGRYPHRNAILQRESTKEEREFLQQPGSSF
jgi:uncharacterized protein (DUF924 family)